MRFHNVEMIGPFICQLMTTAQRIIATPTTGRLVHDSTDDKLYMGDGSNWEELSRGDLDILAFVPGDLKMSAAAIPASGWLTCNGAAVSRVTYVNLFTAIGINYGPGDGATTFNVPDFRGRTILGAGTGAGLTARALGDIAGAEEHQLTIAEMPAHTHDLNHPSYVYNEKNGDDTNNVSTAYPPPAVSASTGGDGAHNNMQPFGVANVFIKT